MNIKVMYHSQTGNTKKVANAIAEAAGASAEPISEGAGLTGADILFIGDGVYGGKPDAKTRDFINSLEPGKVKYAAVFGTYGGQKKFIEDMKESLKTKGIKVSSESFGCKGKAWFIFNRRHPDEQELKMAQEFAKRIIKEASK
jgi:flavodoxin I